MATPPRVEAAGAVWHVTQHATGTDILFADDVDHSTLLRILAVTVDRKRWLLHAYCLLTNHLHLVFETREANLAAGMRDLTSWYVRRFNARHGRRGRLAMAPYYSGLVETDEHLLAALAYVAVNPVRAGLCQRAEDWPWSSYGGGGTLVAPPSPALRCLVAAQETRPFP
jgi:putative transposase